MTFPLPSLSLHLFSLLCLRSLTCSTGLRLRVPCSNLEGCQQPRCCTVEPGKVQGGEFVFVLVRAVSVVLTSCYCCLRSWLVRVQCASLLTLSFDPLYGVVSPDSTPHRASRLSRERHTRTHLKWSQWSLSGLIPASRLSPLVCCSISPGPVHWPDAPPGCRPSAPPSFIYLPSFYCS